MRRPVCFIGVLQLAKCNSNNMNILNTDLLGHTCEHHMKSEFSACTVFSIRGGAATSSSTRLRQYLSPASASLLAGSIGGAIGVGVSYPFDTISTKAQVTIGSGDSPPSLAGKIVRIFKEEGIGGFFEGVLLTMLGQALIKAIQFSTNELTLNWLTNHSAISLSNIGMLLMSGILSGLVSSFVVSPVELLKIRMQAQNKTGAKNNDTDDIQSLIYSNEFDCARWLVKNEGWIVLFTHGLWITIIREIPSFAIYFAVYGWLAKSSLAINLGNHIAPLVFGAIAGWAMWIPTYPIDIVKTIEQVQTREMNRDVLTWREITAKLYKTGGVKAFFEGLEPKLARAAIKHAVTFWCYEVMMKILRPTAS